MEWHGEKEMEGVSCLAQKQTYNCFG